MKIILLLLGLLLGPLVNGDEESASVGATKAVLEADAHENKFRLSEAAARHLKLKTIKVVAASGRFELPKSALLEWQQKTAVYRVEANLWVEAIEVDVVSRRPKLIVSSRALRSGDEIAVTAVPVLRAAQLEVSGHGGEGHAH